MQKFSKFLETEKKHPNKQSKEFKKCPKSWLVRYLDLRLNLQISHKYVIGLFYNIPQAFDLKMEINLCSFILSYVSIQVLY